MAKTVTNEDIIKINEAYLICKTYSGAAAATGWSATTVKRYIIPNYVSQKEKTSCEITIPSIEETIQKLLSNEHLCSLTDAEIEETKEFQKELFI